MGYSHNPPEEQPEGSLRAPPSLARLPRGVNSSATAASPPLPRQPEGCLTPSRTSQPASLEGRGVPAGTVLPAAGDSRLTATRLGALHTAGSQVYREKPRQVPQGAASRGASRPAKYLREPRCADRGRLRDQPSITAPAPPSRLRPPAACCCWGSPQLPGWAGRGGGERPIRRRRRRVTSIGGRERGGEAAGGASVSLFFSLSL